MIFALRVLPRAKLAHARKGSTCGRLTMQACFGGYELDQERRELRFHDAPVHVEPQVFDLLLHLVANRDRVVSKDEMVGAIWGGRIVSDVTLNSRINAARRAIGDDGKTQALISDGATARISLRRSGEREGPDAWRRGRRRARSRPGVDRSACPAGQILSIGRRSESRRRDLRRWFSGGQDRNLADPHTTRLGKPGVGAFLPAARRAILPGAI